MIHSFALGETGKIKINGILYDVLCIRIFLQFFIYGYVAVGRCAGDMLTVLYLVV